ncbi:gamma-glutamyl hydrolase-like [Ctenocephalides felis]|uniref:gamma-glutamyl hydrolase-like n=1 Tax=Ctenocephalides felis TaxID=7515 RepID=UPI000E6E109C|nr:gamma-glutamyl hydrolase-like [Ctenocephalides felis]
MLLLYTFSIFLASCAFAAVPIVEEVNETPVVGILTQEIAYSLNQQYPDQFKSYIAASYVKFVEGGGARVVPIWIDKDRDYYKDIMNKVSGVLFPGGATWFNQSDGYADAGRHIFDIAKEMNDNGQYMPLWGTCLGFELLLYLDSNGENRAHCSSSKQPLPLEFKQGYGQSRMFSRAPMHIMQSLANEPITANFHQYCVTEQNLTKFEIDHDWNVLSVNKDWNGLEFISSIESVRYPFYGVQFHPEKNIYEWVPNRNISHTLHAVQAAQYFAEFFVNEARKSPNKFDEKELDNEIIYNYHTTFTGLKGSSFEECYMFADPPLKKTNQAAERSAPKVSCQYEITESDTTEQIKCNDAF